MSLYHAYSLGPYRIEPSECAIYLSDNDKQSLQPKFIEVLNYLAQHYPKVVSREELINSVWLGNEYVGEKALTNAIWHLRQALKAEDGQDIIETIRKTGYRLCIKPEKVVSEDDDAPRSTRPYKKYWLMAAVALVLMSWASFFWWQGTLTHVTPQLVPENITTDPGLELFPAPSPDGQFLVYKSKGPNGNKDLFLLDLTKDNATATNLTTDIANEGRAVWSRDSQYLYFRRQIKESRICDVIQLRMHDQQEKVVGHCPLSGGDLHHLDISVDDNTLAYLGVDEQYKNRGIYLVNPHQEVPQAKRYSCLEKDCHFRVQDVAFSPDGKFLALSRRESTFSENIYLTNLASGDTQQLTFDEDDIVGMSWLPNGKELIYAVQKADTRSGYRLNIATMQRTALNLDGFSYPAFERNKNWLYYQYRKEQYQITSLAINTANTSSPFPLIQSDYNHKYPDYSAATDKIAYVSNESGTQEIWIADASGRHRQRLTNMDRPVRYPSWSHDGSRIAFLAPNDDRKSDSIYIVDVNSAQISQIASPFDRHNRPSWSIDDLSIMTSVYTDKHNDIYQFRIDGSMIQRLSHNGGRYAIAQENGLILYSRNSGELWQIDSTLHKAKAILNKQHFASRYSWTYKNGQVYFMSDNDDYQEISQLDLATLQQSLLLRVPSDSVAEGSALSFDEQHQRLLFTNTLFYQADIKLVRNFE